MIIQLSSHAELHGNPEINNHEIKKEDPEPVVQITSGSGLTHSVTKCLSGVCTGLVKPHFKSFKVACISLFIFYPPKSCLIRCGRLTRHRLSSYHTSQMTKPVCLLQKRKVEAVPMATQVPPAPPVPSLPSSTEASQASVFPAVREPSTFKSREDHEPISLLTTVKKTSLS